MPELLQTLNSKRDKEMEERKFLASLQGVDLEEPVKENKTFDDIRRKALGINTRSDDVVSLQGDFAAEAGFGIGAGLGYRKE
jgi:hypothetical protein